MSTETQEATEAAAPAPNSPEAAVPTAPRVFIIATGEPAKRRDQALVALEGLLAMSSVDIGGRSSDLTMPDAGVDRVTSKSASRLPM